MAIVRVDTNPVRAATANSTARQQSRKLIVHTSDPNDDENLIIQHLKNNGYAMGQSHPTDLYSWVQEIRVQSKNDDRITWEAEVSYSSEIKPDENPMNAPPEIEFGFAQHTKRATKDIEDKPIQNSAGEDFDEPPEVDDSRPVLLITRNEASFSPVIAINYQDTVNSDAWFGCAPREAKMANIRGQRIQWNQTFYWKVNYEIHFRAGTWDLEILDQGYRQRQKIVIAPKPKIGLLGTRSIQVWKILDGDGQPIEKPQLLNGYGRLLGLDKDGKKIGDPSEMEPIYLKFKVYKERSFNALNLPV